jgi:hypothetical protein
MDEAEASSRCSGHDNFFIFINVKTENQCLYKR